MQNILNRCSTYFFIFDPDNPFEIFEFVPQKKNIASRSGNNAKM